MNIKNNKGFSLVELMIAVVIIGVLAAIAIPQYSQYVRKARQSEAKNALGAMYTAEKNYTTEFNYSTSSMNAIGYVPDGRIHYDCGWTAGTGAVIGAVDPNTYPAVANSATVAECARIGAARCADGRADFGAAQTVANAGIVPAQGTVTFTIACNGQIGGLAADTWTMNQVQLLANTSSGIN